MKMKLFLFVSIIALLVSCNTSKHTKSSTPADDKASTDQSVKMKTGNSSATVSSKQTNTSSSNANSVSLELMKKEPNLKSLSEITGFFEMLDISYYPDLVNDPINAHKYKNDEKKTAANLGAYLGDMVYVMGTEGYVEAYKNFGAAMELAQEVGIEGDFPNIVVDRYEGKMPMDSVMELFDEALNKSEEHLSASDKQVFYDFMLYGNYIEKIHVISGVLERVTKTKLPDVAAADLKRNLLIFMAKQRKPLEEVYSIMTPYFDNSPNLINKNELKDLIKMYKKLEENKDDILKLDPIEIYNAKEVRAIQKQIDIVRTRIVK